MTRAWASLGGPACGHQARPLRCVTAPMPMVILRFVLCAAALAGASAACAPDPDDAGRAGVPPEPVSFIEGADGPLWLGAPPAGLAIADDVLAEAARGVMPLRAIGCGAVSNGTAFAVAPGLLVGAAHVIAGASKVEVDVPSDGAATTAAQPVEVVGYSEERDLALLRTDAAVSPLSIDRARLGGMAAVLGYPEGAALEASPARIEHYVSASGLWGDGMRRRVYVLAVNVRAGQSGAPLVDPRGSVVGVAFATTRGPSDIGFALSRDELLGFLVSSGVDARIDYLGRTVVRAQPGKLRNVPNGTCARR